MMRVPILSLALAGVLAAQGPSVAEDRPAPRAVDLAICLDISGSMNGLLNAARQNLWAVVNDLAALQPTPRLRVALFTYGCDAHAAEAGWVKLETGFTNDLDLVSQKLFELTTNGSTEYVGRVLHDALTTLDWSPEPGALKLLFVAGNESATQDPKHGLADACSAAIQRGIAVNTIFCGDPKHADANGWRDAARLAEGRFAAIEQDANLVVATPFDDQLAALSTALNGTYVPYGAEGSAMAANQTRQDGNASSLNTAAAAQRCQTKGGSLYWNGNWDLVDACKDPKFVLAEVDKKSLPEALRGCTTEQLRAHVDEQAKRRAALQHQIDALGKQRDAHVHQELQRRAATGEKVFEQAVLEAVRAQAAVRGFTRSTPMPAVVPVRAGDCDSPFVPVLRAAARDYEHFVLVTGAPKQAPTDCYMKAPFVRRSTVEQQHGGKLYLLYARFADGREYVRPGEPEKTGQTLVKQSWVAEPGEPHGATEASKRHAASLVLRDGAEVWHAGDYHGLFVMHKLAPDTEGTDQGWIYGTIDRDGVVTSAGKVASCIRCHEGATEDRRFGLR